MQRFLGTILLTLAVWTSGGPAPAAVVVTVENPSPAERPAGPATFGIVCARGEVAGALAEQALPTQIDVKRRWPDGSIKHAVATVALPPLAAGARQPLVFVAGKPAAGTSVAVDELAGVEDVVVKFQTHGGPAESASLRQAVAAGKPVRAWLEGSLVGEWHYRAVPASDQGVADPALEVHFHVRAYPAAKTARVAVVVENCRWNSPGNVPYDVQVLVGGKEAFARKDVGRFEVDGNNQRLKAPEGPVGHAAGGRWVKRFWVGLGGGAGRPLDDVHVRHDVAALGRTGLLPRYDHTLQVPETVLAALDDRWGKAANAIMQNGFILPYFPATGGRADIGPLPAWTAQYVVSQDPRALAVVLGNGDLSASCPVHWRDQATGWLVSIDDHPRLSLGDRGGKSAPMDVRAESPWVLPGKSQFSVDSAHQPSLAYVPYLITGDFFYLEEMQFWANWNLIAINPAYRQYDQGILTCTIQVRGVAWALRQLIHAAALTPDAGEHEPHAAYFAAKLANNIRFYDDFLAGKLDFKPVAIGTFPPAVNHAYGNSAEERHRFGTTAGWMHNFLAWSLIHAVEQGYAEAVPARDYFTRLAIGSMTHPDEIPPFAGTAYYLPLGERTAAGPHVYYGTWREVRDGFEKMGLPEPQKVAYPDAGDSYSYIARGVLIESLRAGLPGAREALTWLDGQLPKRRQACATNPTWAFLPPGDE